MALLDRAASGDPGCDLGFLDHDDVYDGFGARPGSSPSSAVARGPDTIGTLSAGLPDSPDEAAAACGFGPGFDGAVHTDLTQLLSVMREFHRAAATGHRPPDTATGRPPRNP